MKRLSHVALWAGTILVLAFVSFPRWLPLVSASGSPTTPPIPSASEKQVVLGIEGMTCGGCARNVESALSTLAGVKSVSVSYERREAVIVAAPSVTEESLVRAVEGAGYRVAGEGTSEKPDGGVDATTSVTLLRGTLAPLVDQFNRDDDKPRVLALLSPT